MIESWGSVHFATVTLVITSTGDFITGNRTLPVGDTVTLKFDMHLHYFVLGEYGPYTFVEVLPNVVEVTLVTGFNLELPDFTITADDVI